MKIVKTYRKKPVMIEALLWSGEKSWPELKEWVGVYNLEKFGLYIDDDQQSLSIETLEGRMKANVDDYVIRGVKGEYYPCKPDIFQATYEEVDPKLNASLGQL